MKSRWPFLVALAMFVVLIAFAWFISGSPSLGVNDIP